MSTAPRLGDRIERELDLIYPALGLPDNSPPPARCPALDLATTLAAGRLQARRLHKHLKRTLRDGTLKRSPLACYSLIAVEVLSFLVAGAAPATAISLFGYSSLDLEKGQLWTLVTSLFVHINVFHLAINLLFLYVFGTALEEERGAKLMTATFFLGGVLSLLIGAPFYSANTKIVGSSIAVSALIGASLVVLPNKQAPIFFFRAPLGLMAVIYLVFNAFLALEGQTIAGIAYPSHVIGFVVGAAVAIATRNGHRPSTEVGPAAL